MKGLKWWIVMAGILTALATLFSGCSSENNPGNSGGVVTDKTDPDAPKVINSKELTALETYYYLNSRWTSSGRHKFHFILGKDENGSLTITEKEGDISLPADDGLVSSIQKIIDDNDIAKSNGVYRTVSGLPEPFRPSYFRADYASGEKIEFTVQNDPGSKWGEELYDLLARYFSENGNDSLYPEKETSRIRRIDITVWENGIQHTYNSILVDDASAIDNETTLLERGGYDKAGNKITCREFMLIPDDYYDKITQIIADTDMVRNYDYSFYASTEAGRHYHDMGYYGMGNENAKDDEEDLPDSSLDLYIEYESGKQIRIKTGKESEILGMKPITDKLREYHDSLFENAKDEEKRDMLPKDTEEEEDGYELKQINVIIDDSYSLGNEKKTEEFVQKWEEAVAEEIGHEIKLNVTQIKKAGYTDEVTRILNDGKPGDEGYPDAVLMSGNMMEKYEKAGYLWDMSSVYDHALFKDRVIADADNHDRRDVDGGQFGFTPVCGSGCVTYIKAAWFDVYAANTDGIDSIEDIDSLEKYVDMLRYFCGGGNHGILSDGIIGRNMPYTDILPELWLEAHPSVYYKNGAWTDGFLEPECLNALKRLDRAVSENIIDPDSFELESKQIREKYTQNDQSRSAMAYTYWSGEWMRQITSRMDDNGLYEELEDDKLLMLPPIKEIKESCGGYYRTETPMWVIIADDDNDGREKAVFKALFETMLDGAEVQALWTKYAPGAHWDMVIAPPATEETKKTDELVVRSRDFFMQNSAPAPVYADLNSMGAEARKLVAGRDQLILDVARRKKTPEEAVEEYEKKYKDISDAILDSLNDK